MFNRENMKKFQTLRLIGVYVYLIFDVKFFVFSVQTFERYLISALTYQFERSFQIFYKDFHRMIEVDSMFFIFLPIFPL
jgi:hypothetical protein